MRDTKTTFFRAFCGDFAGSGRNVRKQKKGKSKKSPEAEKNTGKCTGKTEKAPDRKEKSLARPIKRHTRQMMLPLQAKTKDAPDLLKDIQG